jgi:hypothetical protein
MKKHKEPKHVIHIFGRWMVTGPNCADRTGWSLCLRINRKCERCVAEFTHQGEAIRFARYAYEDETDNKCGSDDAKIRMSKGLRRAFMAEINFIAQSGHPFAAVRLRELLDRVGADKE